MSNAVYVNITSEGARVNPQILDSEEHALSMFMLWRSNDTTMQAEVVGIERVKYYLNTSDGQQWKEENALVVEFGPLLGYVPLSETGLRNERQMFRYIGRYIAVIPDRYNPNSDGKALLLFSRQRAIELMQGANLNQLQVGETWTGVVTMRTAGGYMVNVAGYRAWLPMSLVSYSLSKATDLEIGEMIQVKITDRVKRQEGTLRLVVSRRDAVPNPFDIHGNKYAAGGSYLAQMVTLSGRSGYATLNDGVQIRVVPGRTERDALRPGTRVLVRIRRVNAQEKVLEGTIAQVISQPKEQLA